MGRYRVRKRALGAVVEYNCAKCGAPLTSNLNKAGEQDSCPDCGSVFLIPGEKERQHLMEQAALEKKRKLEEQIRKRALAAEEARRKEEERKARENVVSTAMIPAPPPITPTPPAGAPRVNKPAFGDGILELAFSIARGFSVIVIVAFTGLLAVSLLIAGGIHLTKRKVDAPPAVPPTAQEFSNYIASLQDTSSNRQTYNDGRVERDEDQVSRIARIHHLSAFTTRLNRKAMESMDTAQQVAFLTSLESLLDTQGKYDKDEAAQWITFTFVERIDSHANDLKSDRKHNAFLNQVSLAMAVGSLYLFLGLMAFVAFPLLIRIERNTRAQLAPS